MPVHPKHDLLSARGKEAQGREGGTAAEWDPPFWSSSWPAPSSSSWPAPSSVVHQDRASERVRELRRQQPQRRRTRRADAARAATAATVDAGGECERGAGAAGGTDLLGRSLLLRRRLLLGLRGQLVAVLVVVVDEDVALLEAALDGLAQEVALEVDLLEVRPAGEGAGRGERLAGSDSRCRWWGGGAARCEDGGRHRV